MKYLFIPLLALCSQWAHASFDKTVEAAIAPVSKFLSDIVFYKLTVFGAEVPWIVIWLIVAAVFFTVYLGFANIRYFPLAVRHLKGDFHDESAPGEISHFQAVATAISGTVGIGNIGGIAIAMSIGGPGAAFWMIFAGVLAMSTKLVECTLGVKYRRYNEDGSVSGGPMYYLQHACEQHGWIGAGRLLGGFYAVCLVVGCLGSGNMFQSNQAYVQMLEITGGDQSVFAERGWLFGLLLAGAIGLVVVGGIRSIARFTEKVVPFMALLYMSIALLVIAMSWREIPAAFALVYEGAFSVDSVTGGLIGAMLVGFQRALFSNEAGIGTASIAHAAVKTRDPASEGIVSLLEPFIDTVVISSLSALVILTTAYPLGLNDGETTGIALTSASFAHHFSWAPYLLAVAALLFAFSTVISWSYYGLKAWTFLVGEGHKRENSFKVIYLLFTVIGCMISLDAVLDFSDALVFMLAIPNIIGLYMLAPVVKRELDSYWADLKAGRLQKTR